MVSIIFTAMFSVLSFAADGADAIQIKSWAASGPATFDSTVVRSEFGNPSLRIERIGGAGTPEFLSDKIPLPDGEDQWIVSGWMKLKDLYFEDPSFRSTVTCQWFDKNGNPVQGDGAVFNSYDIQQQERFSLSSGTLLAFDWIYIQKLIRRPSSAMQIQFKFGFAQGDGTAWLTDLYMRSAANAMDSGGALLPAPAFRFRDGAYALKDSNKDNLPLFSPGEPVTFSIFPSEGSWEKLIIKLTDRDGGILWSAGQSVAGSQEVMITIPADVVRDVPCELLELNLKLTGTGIQSETALIGFGILPAREPISREAQLNSPFGMIGSNASTTPRGMEMMRRTGIQWVRQRGQRWYQPERDVPQEIADGQFVKDSKRLYDNGFMPLIQIFGVPAPDWALDPDWFHRGNKQHLLVEPFKEWMTNVAGSMPEEFIYFKMLNERDRDPRPEYLDKFVELMSAGAAAFRAVRPDAIISMDGGFTPEIVTYLLERGFYDHLDSVDYHLYGDFNLVLDLNDRLKLVRDAGYQPAVIASELGVVTGSGEPTVDPRKIARGLFRNVSSWLAIGGTQFYEFLWGTIDDRTTQMFANQFLVSGDGDFPTASLFAYAQLSRVLEGAKLLNGPVLTNGLHIMSFMRGDERTDMIWADGERARAGWKGAGELTVIEALGRTTVLHPSENGVIIEVGRAPVMVISKAEVEIINAGEVFPAAPAFAVSQNGGLISARAATEWTVAPVLPRGWTAESAGRQSWNVSMPAGVLNGDYTLRWRLSDAAGKDRAFVFDALTVVPELSVEVIGNVKSGGKEADIVLQNRGSSAWNGNIETVSPPEGRLFPETKLWKNVTVPAGETVRLTWKMNQPFPANEYDKDPVFTIRLMSGDRPPVEIKSRTTFREIPKFSGFISADGNLNEWTNARWMEIPAERFVRLNRDGSEYIPANKARVALAHGEKWLALAVEVTDSIHWNEHPPATMWQGDGIEFVLGVRPGNKQELPAEFYKLGLALTQGEEVAYGYRWPAGHRWAEGNWAGQKRWAVVRTEDNRTIYELVLFYDHLRLTNNDGISFGMAIDDSDETKARQGYLPLFGGVVKIDVEKQGWFTLE
ncbi:MAG: hypothetical protein WC959_02120 [Kiritimatiellales bacterium]